MAESGNSQPANDLLITERSDLEVADPVRKVGEPETITHTHGDTPYSVQFWVARQAGNTYVVAEEIQPKDREGISPQMTQGTYFVKVEHPENPEAVDEAVDKVRKRISGQGFEE